MNSSKSTVFKTLANSEMDQKYSQHFRSQLTFLLVIFMHEIHSIEFFPFSHNPFIVYDAHRII